MLDRLVIRIWLSVAVVPSVIAAIVLLADLDSNGGLEGFVVPIGALAAALVAVLISSLVDWYWVLPRIAGLVRPGPWESSGDQVWRQVTRWWLIHRVAARAMVSLALAVAVGYVAAGVVPGPAPQVWFIVSLVWTVALTPVNEGVFFLGHPSAVIGDVLRTDEGLVCIVDVSLEGARFKRLPLDERNLNSARPPEPDGLIRLRDLSQYGHANDEDRVLAATIHAFPEYWRPDADAICREREWIDVMEPLLTDAARKRRERERPFERLMSAELVAASATVVFGIATLASQFPQHIGSTPIVVVAISVAAALAGGIARISASQIRGRVVERDAASPVRLSGVLDDAANALNTERQALATGLHGQPEA